MKTKGHRESSQDVVNMMNLRKSSRIAKLSLSASPNIKELVPKTSDFIEPELAKPGPTGFLNLPTSKVKKEYLWSSKYRRPSSGSRESTPGDDTTEVLEKIESTYRDGLKKEEFEQESDIRHPNQPRRSKRLRATTPLVPPSTPKRSSSSSSSLSSGKSLKKAKVTSSPIKPPRNKLYSLSTVKKEKSTEKEKEKETQENDDFCSSCELPGILICCESCPKSFHFTCCDPPLEEAPEDEWYCQECYSKIHPPILTEGIFGKLLFELEKTNPKEFKLPVKFQLPKNESQLQERIKDKNWDLEALYDENDKPYLCHCCGGSGLNRRTLIHCDYCPLVYHIDCLNPPMFGPKTLGEKWKCPNHIDDLIPKDFPKMFQYIEGEQHPHTNFIEISNGGNKSTIYRIPETLILIDFIDKVEKRQVLDSIQEYDNQSRIEQNPEEFEAVENLNEIKERQKVLNLDALLKVANDEKVKLDTQESLDADEIQDLLKIKYLMKLKGQEALLKFLQS